MIHAVLLALVLGCASDTDRGQAALERLLEHGPKRPAVTGGDRPQFLKQRIGDVYGGSQRRIMMRLWSLVKRREGVLVRWRTGDARPRKALESCQNFGCRDAAVA